MRAGHAMTAVTPVTAAGVGVRYGGICVIRLASFRLADNLGNGSLGIVIPHPVASATLIDVLSGRTSPTYGALRVLGHDLGTPRGRTAVRRYVGIASRAARVRPGIRIRGLVDHAARPAVAHGSDRHLLVAAVLDRLALTGWAEVPLRAAPELIARKARLAAACVHQPKLLIVDGLLDQLHGRDLAVLADIIADLANDTAVLALGRDAAALGLVCQQVLTLAGGIVTGTADAAPLAPEEPGLDRVST